jgi:hypothetical protein
MQLHVESSDLAAIEFRETLGALGLAQQRVAEIFGVEPRNIRRWRRGDRPIPRGVAIVLRLLASGVVSVAQVEQAAVPVLVRMNGSAEPEPPAFLPGEPALEATAEQAVVPVPIPARMSGGVESEPPALLPGEPASEVAALADSGLTTAEKVWALTPRVCRWPCGHPEDPGFYFCGNPIAGKPPYCDHHRAMAFRPVPRRRSCGALDDPARSLQRMLIGLAPV